MTLATEQVKQIFADAYAMHDSALERLTVGDIRNAAEKAWLATLRATNALILARTGMKPETTHGTSQSLDRLAHQESAAKGLVGRYYSRLVRLHGDCFCSGMILYLDEIEQRIYRTWHFIRDAEGIALRDRANPGESDEL